MNRDRYIWLAVVLIIVLIGVAIYFDSQKKENYVWSPQYNNEKSQPYDLSLFRKSLEASYGENFVELTEPLSDIDLSTYEGMCFVSIANAYFDSTEAAQLRVFAESGNTVFLSAEHTSELLREVCTFRSMQYFMPLPSTKAKRIELSLQFAPNDSTSPLFFAVKNEIQRNDWAYFPYDSCAAVPIDTLGSFTALEKRYLNYIALQVGDGALHFHATPLLFTNYHYRNRPIYDHVNSILNQEGFEKILYYNPQYKNNNMFDDSDADVAESPLSFILSQQPLRYAWYGLLILGLIYVLHAIRRDQREVPIIPVVRNNSADYLDLRAKLYRRSGNHKYLIAIQEKLLRKFLFRKYRLPLGELDPAYIREAAIRLQMKEDYLRNLFRTLDRSKHNSSITETEVMEIHKQLNAFYAQCP